MKKILAITSLLALLCAGIAYAAGVTATNPEDAWAVGDGSGNATITADGVGTGVTCTMKLSANVASYYHGSANNYIINTAHGSGSKTFVSAASDNRIYMKENPGPDKNSYISDTSKTEPAKIGEFESDGSVDFTGWTAVK